MGEHEENIWHLSRIMKENLAIDISHQRRWTHEERLAAMKAAPLLLGWVGERSAGLVLEPSVFESGCLRGRRNWTKLAMAAGARDSLKNHRLSSLQIGLEERRATGDVG